MQFILAAASAVPAPLHWADLGLQRGIAIGPFMLRYYSLAYLAGILVAYWHIGRMIRQPGAPLAQRHVDDLFFWCTLGVILGGRLGYAAFYTGGASGTPSLFTHFTEGERVSWDLLRLWDGGMSFHGGLIGVLLAIGWVAWRGGLSFVRVCDYVGVCTPFGVLFGRIANFINGELWGRVAESDVPWAMVFPGAGDLPRHPSQLYEAGLEGLGMSVFLVLLFWKTGARWRPGLLAGAGLLWYGTSRFVIEFFREPDAQLEAFARMTHMSMGQWLTVPMILIGAGLVLRALARPALGSAPKLPA